MNAEVHGDGRSDGASSISKQARGDRVLSICDALAFSERQVSVLVDNLPGRFPTYTKSGRWVAGDDEWAPSWAGGFLTGMMWIFAEHLDERWRERAENYCLLLESRKRDRGTHDLGFVLEPSWGRWFDAYPTSRAESVIIEGGRTLARRLQEPGGYLSTWVDPGSTFIDVMMNVGLIFRAAKYSGDRELFEVGLRHCRTSIRHLMRGDGSTIHEGWFDKDTGEFLRAATHQGWRSDSSWARGQAWAIYGFSTSYQHTGARDLLDAAMRAADYYILNTDASGVPPNDWLDPNPVERYESSAAAIAAAGMQRLSEALGDDPAADRYRAYGTQILSTLCSTAFVAIDTPGWDGILRHAIYHQRNGLGVDESVMWGDYYFVEALGAALHDREEVRG